MPFTEPDCLCQMYFDVWAIKQSIPKFFWRIKKPYYQLAAYYKKYGDIGTPQEIIDEVDRWYDDADVRECCSRRSGLGLNPDERGWGGGASVDVADDRARSTGLPAFRKASLSADIRKILRPHCRTAALYYANLDASRSWAKGKGRH